MRAGILKPIEPGMDKEGTYGWVLLALLAVGVPWGIWSVCALLGSGGSQMVALDAGAGWFILLSLGYLGLHGLQGLAWCSVPVLLTLQALVEFVGIPAWRFAAGADLADSTYTHAMFLTLIGFAAFWIGGLAVMKDIRLRFVSQVGDKSSRLAFMSATMLGLGVGGKLVMWKAGLFSYIADPGSRESSLWFIQWLGFLANLLNAALIVSAIEVLGKRSTKPFMRSVFCLSVVFSIGFGVISGMKGEIMFPLLYLVLVYRITNGRIPRSAFLLLLLPVVIYPFSNAYRYNLGLGYGAQVNTVEGLGTVLKKSFDDVVDSPLTKSTTAGQGLDNTTSRLSELAYVREVISLPDPSVLNGDEKIWFAPFYPLVPRVFWKDKPVLNKGIRLSVALGRPATTSSALTPIGDLYSMYGTSGVAVGMFLYGICLQLYMNWVGHEITNKRLFVYISLIIPLINPEADVFSLVASVVQSGIVFLFMASVIYGWPVGPFRIQTVRDSIEAA